MNRNRTVLVISDRQKQFALAASWLMAEGYSVRFAEDLNQSLQIAKSETPGVIISELAVPDIDGLQICLQVRNDTRLRSTPILLIGDLAKNSSIVEDGRRCGANDYVQKPFAFNVLAEKVLKMAGAWGFVHPV